MEKRCPKCGKGLDSNWVYEPGLGQICHRCYIVYVVDRGYDLDESMVTKSLNANISAH